MNKIIEGINRVLTKILIVLMAAIVIDVLWQVFTRFILHHPSSYTEELAGFLLIWIGLLGGSYAVHTKAHLGIDILTYKLTGMKKRVITILIYSFVAMFAFFVMVVGGLRLMNIAFTLKQISPALGFGMGYVYVVIPLAGLLMLVYCAGFITDALRKEPAPEAEHQVSMLD